MAMTFSRQTGKIAFGKILGNPSWVNLLNDTADLPTGAEEGPLSVSVLKDATVTGITSGVMATNGVANAVVNGTVVNGQVTFDILPSNVRAYETNPDKMAQMGLKIADAFIRDMETKMIAALVAATPTDINTLTVGQIDFLDDGTDAEARDNISKLDKCVATVRGNNGGSNKGLFILMAPEAYGNWMTSYGIVRGNAAPRGDGMEDHRGIPVFPIGSTATNWGAADKECMFICAGDSAFLTTTMPQLLNGRIMGYGDAMYKAIWVSPYVYGVLEVELLASILNPAN